MEQPEPRVSQAARNFVFRRANGCCEYCLSQALFSPSPFTMDHIVPRAAGGDNEVGNLVLSCMGCNGHKQARQDSMDPLTGERSRLNNPRRDEWSEHFQWSDDFGYIIGVTPIGRVTVARLHLNRTGVVNLRKSLSRLGLHPPQA